MKINNRYCRKKRKNTIYFKCKQIYKKRKKNNKLVNNIINK